MLSKTVRFAVEKDADHLLVLASGLATSFDLEAAKFKNVLALILSQDHVYLAVVEQGEEILGYVLAGSRPCFYASGEVAWVEEIFVDEKYRGQDLGRTLMESVENWATERGCKLVSLATRRAAPFYLALGYTDSATYFKKNLDHEN